MHIPGEWLTDPDGVTRPYMSGMAADAGGAWVPVRLLVDTGADLTVLHADYLTVLGFDAPEQTHQLAGAGGGFTSVRVPTQLRLTRSDGLAVLINGPFSISTNPASPDGSVLGRDVMDNFALIADRRADVVALLSGRHGYVIREV